MGIFLLHIFSRFASSWLVYKVKRIRFNTKRANVLQQLNKRNRKKSNSITLLLMLSLRRRRRRPMARTIIFPLYAPYAAKHITDCAIVPAYWIAWRTTLHIALYSRGRHDASPRRLAQTEHGFTKKWLGIHSIIPHMVYFCNTRILCGTAKGANFLICIINLLTILP